MSVAVTPMLATDPPETCQGCGLVPSTRRVETCPDVDDVAPVDLFLCDKCQGELKAAMGGGSIDPGQRGGGKVGRHHPDQSKVAAGNVRSGSQLAALLRIVHKGGGPMTGIGATCAEASGPLSIEVGHTVSRNQTATRMGELYERGFVIPLQDGDRFPVKRTTSKDNEGQVWIATDEGRVEAARLAR